MEKIKTNTDEHAAMLKKLQEDCEEEACAQKPNKAITCFTHSFINVHLVVESVYKIAEMLMHLIPILRSLSNVRKQWS